MTQDKKNEKMSEEIVQLLFPDTFPTVAEIAQKYPKRILKDGAMVTRFAPSPTGFLHIGGVYMALICERFAHQSEGVFFMRTEDTDQKRKQEDAERIIRDGLAYFGLTPDEYASLQGDVGAYGPYRQTERKEIYHAYLKKCVEEGKVYPCFCTEEDLTVLRTKQMEDGVRPGYYGAFTKCRHLPEETVHASLAEGKPYVLRLRSQGSETKRVVIHDLIKGDIEMPENDTDVIVMKGDGLPTYHFAHAIDDHLMGTTHVLRADEWVSSTPIHFELFDTLSFPRLCYGHIAPIAIIDQTGAKRKLSKRKDKEANVEYFLQKGYTKETVIDYLMNLANSDFEEWRKENLSASYKECVLTFEKLSRSNAPLLNEVKLADIGKEQMARKSKEEMYHETLIWAKSYDTAFAEKLERDMRYALSIFGIERDGEKKRKDISHFAEVKESFTLFENEHFISTDWSSFQTVLTTLEIALIRKRVAESFANMTSADDFMNVLRALAKELSLAESLKEYKAHPELRGHVGLVAQVLRYAITHAERSPDLFQICKVLGNDETVRRLLL